MKQSGNALQDASEDLKADREIVLAAVKTEPSAIKYASENFKNAYFDDTYSNMVNSETYSDECKNFINDLCNGPDSDTFTKFFKNKENISFFECYWEITWNIGWRVIQKTDIDLIDDEDGQVAFSNELFDKALISFELKNEVPVPDDKKKELQEICSNMYVYIVES